jgi:hypothetical protein
MRNSSLIYSVSERLWFVTGLLSDGYRRLSWPVQSGQSVTLATQIYLVPSLGMRAYTSPTPLQLYVLKNKSFKKLRLRLNLF